MKELKIEAVPESLDQVLELVSGELENARCPPKIRTQINIAVEEIFVNIAHYAYNPEIGFALVRAGVSGNEIEIVFEDAGKPYNPLEKTAPDITATVEDRSIGGLGIFMVKKTMDSIQYHYENGKNMLTLKKVIAPTEKVNE